MTSFLSKWFGTSDNSGRRSVSKRPGGFRPRLEELEDRLVPSSVPLQVVGNQLKDSAGQTVVLRGMNIPGLESWPEGFFSDQNVPTILRSADVALNDWHANVIRLTVYPDFWFGNDQGVGLNAGDPRANPNTYRSLVDQIVAKANTANAYVMLTAWGSNMGNTGAAPALHNMPDAGTTAFWQNAAARYANNPTVIFDPFNEPHNVSWDQWRNGGTINENGRVYNSPGMQGLLNTIRATGANNLVTPEGLGWGADLSGVTAGFALNDPARNLMYQIHLYPAHDIGNDGTPSVAVREARVQAISAQYPLFVGEWGTYADDSQNPDKQNIGGGWPNAAAWSQNMLSWLQQHQFSWSAWSLSAASGPHLISDWNYTPTNYFGTFVKSALSMGQAPSSSVPTNPINYTRDTVFKLGNYWIHVPASYDATHQTPTQLFVWSHGWGGQSQYDIYNVRSTAGGPSYITIALDGREQSGWDMDTDPAKILAGIADVKTHFNIDPRRVVLGGYSSGGDLSYRVAFTNSTQIAGVLAEDTAPFRDTGLTQNQALAAPFHFHVVHLAHTGDNTYPIANVRSETNAVKAAGAAGDGWATLQLVERPGNHWDNDNGNSGTVYDLKTFLLPHLGDGWTSLPLAPGPINNNFANKTAITGTTATVTATNVNATKEAGEPNHVGNPGGKSVWWTWTAPASGSVTIRTAGSSFDTTLGVYTGSSVSTLTQVAANDDANGGQSSLVTFNVVAGSTYQIAVDGWDGASGNVILNVALTPAGPVNNTFANRTTISGSNVTVTGTNVNATKEAGEPNHVGNAGGKSVWWTWTAPASGSVTIRTAGSNFDTTLAVYTGSSVSTLTQIAANDDANGGQSSLVTFNVVAGTAYQIAVDGWNGASGSVTLNVALTPAGPVNNKFANRTRISGSNVTVTGTNAYATREAGEPNHAGNTGGKSVWWTWTAPTSGRVTISTAGSNFDTTLGVYRGTSVSALTLIASNDDAAGGQSSLVTFNAIAGVTYNIAVDGYNGAFGNITLNVRYA